MFSWQSVGEELKVIHEVKLNVKHLQPLSFLRCTWQAYGSGEHHSLLSAGRTQGKLAGEKIIIGGLDARRTLSFHGQPYCSHAMEMDREHKCHGVLPQGGDPQIRQELLFLEQ